MRNPTEFEVTLGRFVRSKLGTDTRVVRFADDGEKNDVFIVSGRDCPVKGVTSYGSVGLANCIQHSGSTPVNVELLGACAAALLQFDNLVASCVFESMKNGANIAYGSFIENILDQYRLSSTLRHVTFVAPILWDGLDKAVVGEKTVYWLLMLLLSDSELTFLKQNGIDALEKVFEKMQIDIFDINRAPAL